MGVFRVNFPNINPKNKLQYWAFIDLPDIDDLQDVYELLYDAKPVMGYVLYCKRFDRHDGTTTFHIETEKAIILTTGGIASVEAVKDTFRFWRVGDHEGTGGA